MAHIIDFDADAFKPNLEYILCERHGIRNTIRFALDGEMHEKCYGCFVENMVGFLG